MARTCSPHRAASTCDDRGMRPVPKWAAQRHQGEGDGTRSGCAAAAPRRGRRTRAEGLVVHRQARTPRTMSNALGRATPMSPRYQATSPIEPSSTMNRSESTEMVSSVRIPDVEPAGRGRTGRTGPRPPGRPERTTARPRHLPGCSNMCSKSIGQSTSPQHIDSQVRNLSTNPDEG
jgi:hypothetical protein